MFLEVPLADQVESLAVVGPAELVRFFALDHLAGPHNARLAQGTTIETFGRGAVDYALAKPGAVVAVLPAFGDDVGLAIFRRPQSRQAMKLAKSVSR